MKTCHPGPRSEHTAKKNPAGRLNPAGLLREVALLRQGGAERSYRLGIFEDRFGKLADGIAPFLEKSRQVLRLRELFLNLFRFWRNL